MDLLPRFDEQVRATLGEYGFRWEADANVGGARLDLLVFTQTGAPLAALEFASPIEDIAPSALRVKMLVARVYEQGLAGLPVLVVVPDNLTLLADDRRIVRLQACRLSCRN